MDIINYLEQTHQLDGIMNAIRNDFYQEWLSPVIQYAEEREVSALGLIQTVIDYYCDVEVKRMGSV